MLLSTEKCLFHLQSLVETSNLMFDKDVDYAWISVLVIEINGCDTENPDFPTVFPFEDPLE